MKNKLLFLVTFLILIFSSNAYGYEVSERVRVGIKYGSTAVNSSSVFSSDGFIIRAMGTTDKIIGETNSASVTVKPYTNNGINSYLIAEQSGFETLEATLLYCKANGFATYPFYSSGVFYAVRQGIYTYNDALLMQNQAKLTNITAFILDPAPTRVIFSDAVTGECILIFSQDGGEIPALEGKNGKNLDFGNGNVYRDIMEFKRVNNSLYLINNIRMQNYLYSVVAAEIGASAPFESQKAQAICARTYTEENLLKHKGDGFNLCSTTHCQVYNGTKNENNQVIKSVQDTNNMIMTYNGKPISAVYFAHSGGYTANVEDIWGTPYPYLKSVKDEYCTDYTWEYKIDYNDITKKMADKGYNLGTVTDIKVTKYTDYGLVKQLTITGTKGSKTFENTSARNILGLKSQCYTIPAETISHLVKTEKSTSLKNITTALTKDGIKTLGGNISVKNGNGKTTVLTAQSGSIIYGKGNGHHAGLSQHGAMEYAKRGWTYEQILKHYYKGITIEGE